MANTTKISNYRSGSPRFGTRDYKDSFDNSVKISYLSPEELEEYRSGKRGGMKLFTFDDYQNMKNDGKSNADIAKEMNISEATLYKRIKVWKGETFKPKGDHQEKVIQPHTEEKKTNETNCKWKEEKANYEQIIAELKSNLEQVSAENLKIQELRKDNEFWKKKVLEFSSVKQETGETSDDAPDYHELFDNAMSEKENLQKEILILENQLNTTKEDLKEILKKHNELIDDYFSLKEEMVPLRQLVLIDLRNKVGALT